LEEGEGEREREREREREKERERKRERESLRSKEYPSDLCPLARSLLLIVHSAMN
jgi:hypothetical protein